MRPAGRPLFSLYPRQGSVLEEPPVGKQPLPQVLPYCEGVRPPGDHVTVPQGTFQSLRNSLGGHRWYISLSQPSYLLGL